MLPCIVSYRVSCIQIKYCLCHCTLQALTQLTGFWGILPRWDSPYATRVSHGYLKGSDGAKKARKKGLGGQQFH